MSDFLEHYGVLGMKWGIRKYENPDGTLTEAGKRRYAETGENGYVYKSHATKKYDRKAAKAQEAGHLKRAEKFKQRADISRQIDAREENYARSVKGAGNILARFATGGIVGGKGYQQHVAMNGKTRNTGNKFISAMLSYGLNGDIGSRVRKAAVIRSNENTALGSLGRNIGGSTFDYRKKKQQVDKRQA